VVSDRYTGLAIKGYDPVAYFVDGRAEEGRADLEYPFAGVIWRFRNQGNRAAFRDSPATYMPQFGGYDPMAVARGVATPGNPLVWSVAEDRLYLFFSYEARAQFLADAERMTTAAEVNWPAVQSVLVP
jgi:hypothetical protein